MKKLFWIGILSLSCSVCYAQSEVHQHDHIDQVDSVATVDTVRVVLDGEQIVSVSTKKEMIEGSIIPYNYDKKYVVDAIDRTTGHRAKLRIEYDGRFWGNMPLSVGANYIDVIVREKTKQGTFDVDSTHKILFFNQATPQVKQTMLWIEQFATAKFITDDSLAVKLIDEIKNAGFTSIAIEAKSAEGYASYRKNELSGTPYLSATKNVRHKDLTKDHLIVQTDTLTGDTISVEKFDLLGALAGAADTMGVKVYAVFNFFTQGNITTRDTTTINAHPEWETYTMNEYDSLAITPLSNSGRGREARDKGNRLQYAFTNPANDEVQQNELSRVREVLQNYPIDGVIIGRCRYDGLDTDFSEISRRKFENFLAARGKQLKNFPQDVNTNLRQDWIEFRASIISDFVAQLRKTVDSCRADDKIELASYVGGWYDRYYGYGVNWASSNFRYNDRLSFDNSDIYTQNYAATSFLHNLNFLIVGIFDQSVKREVALCELLTNGELPVMVALKMPEQMDAITVLHAVESSTKGVALLDLSRIGDLSVIAPIIEEVMPVVVVEPKKKK